MIELLTGKPAVMLKGSGSQPLFRYFLNSMKYPSHLLESSLVDPSVRSAWPQDNFRSLAQLARLCIDEDPLIRPHFGEVFKKLKVLFEGHHRLCLICLDNPPNARIQCGHAVVCTACAQQIKRKGEGCPLCRTRIQHIQPGLYEKSFEPGQ